MSLTAADIERIAALARLQLDDAQSARMLEQLNGFFALVERMRSVDTQGIGPLAHPTDVTGEVALRLREDEALAAAQIDRAANQRSAPAVERGLYLVPRVVE